MRRVPEPAQKGIDPMSAFSHTRKWTALLGLAFLSACGIFSGGQQVLARYPAGTFLENLLIGGLGEVYMTNYFEKKIEVWKASDGVSTFAAMPFHPMSMVETGTGLLVFGHGRPFNSGPDFQATNMMAVVSSDGKVGETVAIPQARFLNGSALLGQDKILVADSLEGAIWAVEPRTNRVTRWYDSIEFRPAQNASVFKPGANGLKVGLDNNVYVSNSSTGRIWRIKVAQNGRPLGPPLLVATLPSIDDFAIDFDGAFYVASYAGEVWRIKPTLPDDFEGTGSRRLGQAPQPARPADTGAPAPEAERTVVLSGLEGVTAVAIDDANTSTSEGPPVNALYAVTTGNMLSGGGGQAVLARTTLAPNPGEEGPDQPTMLQKPRSP
jgi:hypothetical protein